MASEQVIKEVTRRLVERFHPEAIILFGSQARGMAGDVSDLDLIVLCEGIRDRNALEADMIAALRGVPIAIDVLAYTPQEYDTESRIVGTVAYPASREGRVVYERAA